MAYKDSIWLVGFNVLNKVVLLVKANENLTSFLTKDIVEIADPILRTRTLIIRISSILSIFGIISFFPNLIYSNQYGLLSILIFNCIANIFVIYLTYFGKIRAAAYIAYLESGIGMSVATLLFGLSIDFLIYLPIIMMLIFIYFDHFKEWLFFSIFILGTFIVPALYVHQFGALDGSQELDPRFMSTMINVITISILCGIFGFIVLKLLKGILNQYNKTNKELESKNLLIKKKNEELELFASMASHDLKTPVRTINSFLGLLEKSGEVKSPEAKEFLEQAQSGTIQLNELIKGISRFAISEEDTKADKLEKTSVILEQLTTAINPNKDVHIKISYGELSDFKILHSHLYLILQNLIENGLKYNEKDVKEITISQKLKTDVVELQVSDNGIGVDKEYLEYIFQPFKKLHASSEYAGSGLGLAICKKLVEMYKGEIKAESDEMGTKMIITLPGTLVI